MQVTEDKNRERPDSGVLVLGQQNPAEDRCWSCGAMRAAHFCQNCGKVQPPEPVDYFLFFGLPYKLNIDLARLEKEFYSLSRHLHPDISATSTQQEQQWALEQSSHLNDAYRTLKDPVKRTEYLLRLQGVALEEQSKAATDEARRTGAAKQQAVPPDLLEEVFELNMQLEEARMNKKMGELEEQLQSELRTTEQNLRAKRDALMQELQGAWDEWDALVDHESASEQERSAVRDKMVDVLNRRNYLRNLLRDIDEVMQ